MKALVTIKFSLDPTEDDKIRIINDNLCQEIVNNDMDEVRDALEDMFMNELAFGDVDVTVEED